MPLPDSVDSVEEGIDSLDLLDTAQRGTKLSQFLLTVFRRRAEPGNRRRDVGAQAAQFNLQRLALLTQEV